MDQLLKAIAIFVDPVKSACNVQIQLHHMAVEYAYDMDILITIM